MNKTSIDQFAVDGGEELIGSNLLECHPGPAPTKLAQLLKHPEDNMYTIEKPGVKKILYQTPWKENGEIKGLVEISFQLVGMPHFIRG